MVRNGPGDNQVPRPCRTSIGLPRAEVDLTYCRVTASARRSWDNHAGTIAIVYVGLDVSLNSVAICVIDASGKPVQEGTTSADAPSIARHLEPLSGREERIGLEAGPTCEWMTANLIRLRLPAISLESRQVKAALDEARTLLAAWRDDYNRVRPNSALANKTPEGFRDRHLALAVTKDQVQKPRTGLTL